MVLPDILNGMQNGPRDQHGSRRDLDIVVANYGADTLSILRNNGSGRFVAAALGVVP